MGNLFSRHAAVKLSLPLSARELSWIWRWYKSCRLETYLTNRAHLQKLAFYSRQRLHALTLDLQLDYERSDGYMVLLRSEKDSQGVQPGLQVLREADVQFKEIDATQALKIEPDLNPDTPFFGALLRNLRLNIPLVGVHGSSVSATIREALDAPRSAVMDEQFKVAISRMGNRVRVAGGAEIGGNLNTKNGGALKTLYKVLQDWFPGAAQLSNGVQEWKGSRPMLPDGPPILGKSGLDGVWLNLGHGSSGWALSCGSARVLADQILGKSPEIDDAGFSVDRLRN